MKTFKIAADKAKEFAAAIKAAVSMEEIRAACSIQQDRSIVYYAKSAEEIKVCEQYGVAA
ncbi:hypothetical protein [Nitrosovibrio sp. Nv6]|uniref:hypothetical protein n=1 Tax=Nitrosovibrio sp. Nv6 TaxID=1855340 RepID=UPI0008D59F57|nr:hypothetical protein [Nitrosovibrio sp. Nv6]SEO78137.1 hypothetical protein SAMN05216316_1080 [Nitrosovibrio sp. Nv6]